MRSLPATAVDLDRGVGRRHVDVGLTRRSRGRCPDRGRRPVMLAAQGSLLGAFIERRAGRRAATTNTSSARSIDRPPPSRRGSSSASRPGPETAAPAAGGVASDRRLAVAGSKQLRSRPPSENRSDVARLDRDAGSSRGSGRPCAWSRRRCRSRRWRPAARRRRRRAPTSAPRRACGSTVLACGHGVGLHRARLRGARSLSDGVLRRGAAALATRSGRCRGGARRVPSDGHSASRRALPARRAWRPLSHLVVRTVRISARARASAAAPAMRASASAYGLAETFFARRAVTSWS